MKHAPHITATAKAASIFTARHKLSEPARPVHVAYLSPEAWKMPPTWGVFELPPAFRYADDTSRAKALETYLGEKPRQWQIITEAISVRPAWAWAILEAGKDLENRSAKIAPPGWYYLQSGNHKNKAEFAAAAAFISRAKQTLEPMPDFDELKRGGIIGAFQITGWTKDSASPWFIGPQAAEIGKAFPLPFIPCPGKLGRFRPFL